MLVITSASADVSTKSINEKVHANVGALLIIQLLLDNITKGYLGTSLTVAPVQKNPNNLFDESTQGLTDYEFLTSAFLTAYYHRIFKYERIISNRSLNMHTSRIWIDKPRLTITSILKGFPIVDNIKIYRLEETTTGDFEIVENDIATRSQPIHNNNFMYRPYPTMMDLASFIAYFA